MSASCGTDAALGSLPLIYPFLVNDPGEGTQAKRRAHATIVDHLVPPMARAESYGDIARLEQLLDEYAQVNAMDPAKAPAPNNWRHEYASGFTAIPRRAAIQAAVKIPIGFPSTSPRIMPNIRRPCPSNTSRDQTTPALARAKTGSTM